jgi:ectoine hydroxylase-related dioxygenase (phytanoyl-CoA dioxygenase family)
MDPALSPDAVARYRADGFLAPIDVFTAGEAAALRAEMEALEAERGALHYQVKPHLVAMVADRIAHAPSVVAAVSAVLGPDLLLWDSAFIVKEAGTESFVSWHQDLTYWGLDDSDGLVSAWVALSPADETTGCMRMIPGSHRAGMAPHVEAKTEANVLSRGQTALADEAQAVACPLAPGQMSLHHGWTLHASAPNRGADRRIGFVMNFIRPSVRQTLLEEDGATLVAGEDRHGHFRPEPRPTADFAPEALALQKAVAAARAAEINRGVQAAT